MSTSPRHLWIRASHRSDRAALMAALNLPTHLAAPVDGHRRLRGPYTAAGTLLEALLPHALQRYPDLVRAHDIEVLSAAPDLCEQVPATRETLTSLAVPEERTRFYSRMRTLRIAHGLCEFLQELLAQQGNEPRSLVIEYADFADPTDAEWLAVCLRRINPRSLTLVICTAAVPESETLAPALHDYTELVTGQSADDTATLLEEADVHRLATAFVDGDGISDEPTLVLAYQQLDLDERAALHDARAQWWEMQSTWAAKLGPIPYHREHGSDPAGAGLVALQAAVGYCIDRGFYDANVEFGERGQAVADKAANNAQWIVFATKSTTALAALGRPDEVESLFEQVRARTTNPDYHMMASYATSMIHTRHLAEGQRDHLRAKALINQAIAFASLVRDPSRAAMAMVFHQNALALIEVHLKNLPEALRLVTEGLARLDRELGPDEQRLHRSVLVYNRAQVLAGMGRLEESLADYTAVIALDPNYPEYYLDRGNLLRKLGRDDQALADYETAIRLSPPFPEIYYNRADIFLSAGDIETGMAGLDYVLELEPTFIDAYINRAGQYVSLGDYQAAARDVAAGRALDPTNPHLLCLLGQLHSQKGELAEATTAYSQALAQDETIQAAWAGRAAIAFDQGDLDAAIRDLTHAVELSDDAALYYNRAIVYRAADRPADAVADLLRALEIAPDDLDAATMLESLTVS